MFKCPVCYISLVEDPYISLEICIRCDTHFGIDDAGPEIENGVDLKERHVYLRELWLLKQNTCKHCNRISYQDMLCVRCRRNPKLACKVCGNKLSNIKCYCEIQIASVLDEELRF